MSCFAVVMVLDWAGAEASLGSIVASADRSLPPGCHIALLLAPAKQRAALNQK